MTRFLRLLVAVFLIVLLLPSAVFAQGPVVRAVLFYSPTCPHCQQVIEEDLPPLFETHGDQLQIIGVDISTEEGAALYHAAIDAMGVPEGSRGVPMLVVGERVLIGSIDIPEIFPGVIEQGLAQGGIDWPAIPELAAILSELAAETPEKPSVTPETVRVSEHEPLTVGERIQQDPVGNALSIVILIGMVFSLVAIGARWILRVPIREVSSASWLIPLLSLLGMGVAMYLTIIELSGDPAVCGPVGDCNAVQQSPYAFLFGMIPIGALGVIGYAAILLTWAASRILPGRSQDPAALVLFALTAVGTGFSIYLTFLEPFVIGATCAWCLTSAILQTVLLWLTVDPARRALTRRQGPATTRHPSRKAM